MPNSTSLQSQFHRSVWVESASVFNGSAEEMLGESTVQFLAECGECLALLEKAWPTTQKDGLDGRSQWQGEVLLDRYELASEIGRGSFGVVYSAIDLELGREVAVKLPLRKAISTEEQHRLHNMPRREAQALAKLVHPNILRIYDVGSTEEHPFFIVSQRVMGACLASSIPLPSSKAARIFAKLADALHCAHSNGIIHRDIKPSNILLDQHGEPLLVDFGLAVEEDNRLHAAGKAGTLIYMSPEQLDGGCATIDERSDVYSLGATLYESLTGEAPFAADSKQELVEAIKRGDLPPTTHLPSSLRTIVERAMDVDPGRRFQTAAELHVELLSVESRDDRLVEGVVVPAWKRLLFSGGNWTVAMACTVILLALYFGNPAKRDDTELLFDDRNVASSPLRSRALLSYIEEQRKLGIDPESYPIGSSGTQGQINLHKAQLQNIWLGYNTDLTNLCFADANLSNVSMPNCIFAGTSFIEARLTGATMNGCVFVDADFSDADLSAGNFNCSNFQQANFFRAELSGANFEGACLAEVKQWNYANLSGANLRGAIVESKDWIERIGSLLSDKSALDGWQVELIPKDAKLADADYYSYHYWLRPAK